jgi:hypothetical protein
MSSFTVLADRKTDKQKTSSVSLSCCEPIFTEYLVEDKSKSHAMSSLFMTVTVNKSVCVYYSRSGIGLCVIQKNVFLIVLIIDNRQYLILVYHLQNLLRSISLINY